MKSSIGKRYSCLFVLPLVLLSPVAARAVTVIDVTTGTTLFYDGFESGDFSSPSPGSWSVGGPDLTVTNASSPGAVEGTYYAQLFRDATAPNPEFLLGTLAPGAASGDLIRLQMMIYIPSASDANARGQFLLDIGNFNTARAWVRPDGAGNVIAVGPAFSLTDTGLNYAADTWQLWELDYVIGSSTFSVSVDGNSASGFNSLTSGNVSVVDLFNGAPDGSFYVDAVPAAVPEPGSWVIAALAALIIALTHCVRLRVRH